MRRAQQKAHENQRPHWVQQLELFDDAGQLLRRYAISQRGKRVGEVLAVIARPRANTSSAAKIRGQANLKIPCCAPSSYPAKFIPRTGDTVSRARLDTDTHPVVVRL